MKADDQTYQLIEDYLAGQLKGEALGAFEKELAQDHALMEQVELQKMAGELVIERRLLEVSDLLEETRKGSGKGGLWKKITGGLAGVLFVAGTVFLLNEKEPAITQNNDQETTEAPTHIAQAAKDASEGIASARNEKTNPAEGSGKNLPALPGQEENNGQEIAGTGGSTADSTQNGTAFHTAVSDQDPAREEPGQENTNVTHVNPCENIVLSANVSVTGTCPEEADGVIYISGCKGGTAPYIWVVSGKGKDRESVLSGLAAGTYQVEIYDSQGCSKQINNITVPEKACSKDYSFNPFTGEVWDVPAAAHAGTLFIKDLNGNSYFEKEIPAGAAEQWNGHSTQGELRTGYFIFVIKYNDGTVRQGSVTIVR